MHTASRAAQMMGGGVRSALPIKRQPARQHRLCGRESNDTLALQHPNEAHSVIAGHGCFWVQAEWLARLAAPLHGDGY